MDLALVSKGRNMFNTHTTQNEITKHVAPSLRPPRTDCHRRPHLINKRNSHTPTDETACNTQRVCVTQKISFPHSALTDVGLMSSSSPLVIQFDTHCTDFLFSSITFQFKWPQGLRDWLNRVAKHRWQKHWQLGSHEINRLSACKAAESTLRTTG